MTAFIKHGDGVVSRDTSPQALAAAVRDRDCTFWLDMQKPTDEEFALLDDVFGFHPLAIEDTMNYMQRPKIESYNHVGDALQHGYFYMVVHGPDLETFREKLRTKEVDLFLSDRYLVTVHEEPMRSVNAVMQRCDADPPRMLDRGTDVLLYLILDHMVDHYEPILDDLQEKLDSLEERALNEPDPSVLTELSVRKRELLNLRRVVAPQREVIAQLTRGEVPFIREGTRIYLRDVQDHLIRTVEMVELYRDLALGARDIYLSSMSNKLNEIMKVLTIITVTALPATIITSFFGMNFEGVPAFNGILGSNVGFWVMMALVCGMIGVLVYVFRRRKWL